MKPKTLILIVAAVGCGLAASYMTSRLLAERAKDQPAEEEKVAVVVAKQKLAMGTLVKNPEQYFMMKEFTKGQEPKKALTSFDQLKDKRLNKPLSTEQFVTSEDLLDGKGGDLPALLPPGMRAIAIRANMETSSGGFVLPNHRVDVIVTVKGQGNDSWSRIVLENMLVLAVDLMNVRDPDKNAHIPSVVTLAATPEEAEKLRMAQAMGEISMVLRPFGDEQPVHTRGAHPIDVARSRSSGNTSSDIGPENEGGVPTRVGALQLPEGGPSAPRPAPEQADPPPPQTHTLVIENGASITKAVYRIDENGQATANDIDRQELGPRPERNVPNREPANAPNGSPPAPVRR
jgi:pilus assembly protein CpaB